MADQGYYDEGGAGSGSSEDRHEANGGGEERLVEHICEVTKQKRC
jgi:hypothetical protein